MDQEVQGDQEDLVGQVIPATTKGNPFEHSIFIVIFDAYRFLLQSYIKQVKSSFLTLMDSRSGKPEPSMSTKV